MGVDGNPRIGNRTLFAGQGRGLSMEQATQILIQDGYLGEGASINDALALIKTSLTRPQYNADGIERIAEAEVQAQFEDYLAAQEESGSEVDPWDDAPAIAMDDFSDDMLEASGYDAATDAIKAEVRALLEMANAQGIDAESIILDAHERTRNATEQDYYEAAKTALEAAITGSNRDRSTPAGSESQGQGQERDAANQELNRPETVTGQAQAATESVAPGTLELAAQTPAEAAALQDAQEQAAKAEAAAKRAADAAAAKEEDRKRIAQASVRAADRFELGQDPLDSLTGQGSMFDDAPEQPRQAPEADAAQDDGAPRLADAQQDESNQSVPDKGISDSGGVPIESFSNMLERLAIIPESFGNMDVKTQREMVSSVIAAIGDLKVRQAIVRLVPVDVMNDLTGKQGASKVFLNNPSVLADPLSKAQAKFSVTTARFFDALRIAPANIRAEVLDGLRKTGRRNAELGTTVVAADENLWGKAASVASNGTKVGLPDGGPISLDKELSIAGGAIPADLDGIGNVPARSGAKISIGQDFGGDFGEAGSANFALDDGHNAIPPDNKKIISDFGEKIGGARKDVWSGFKDDLNKVLDDDIAGQPLAKVWPAPDYQKLIDAGMDAKTVAAVRALRDEVPAKPRAAWKVKRWAEQVKTLRGLANDVMDGKITV